MNRLRFLAARIRDAFRRRKIAEGFAAEMEFHLAELTAQYERKGMSHAEAERAARLRFGNSLQAQENLREQAGFAWLDGLWGDLVMTSRGLRRRPWFAVGATLILALGFAAAIAVFTLLDPVLLRPLPVPDAKEIHAVIANDDASRRYSRGTVERLDALFENGVAAYSGSARVSVQIGVAQAAGASLRLVNGRFFSALGLEPMVGRGLVAADDVGPDGQPVAVAGFTWAVETFGHAEAAVGAEVRINRIPVRIVGVLPPEFKDVGVGRTTHLWLPTALQQRLGFSGNRHAISTSERPTDANWNRDERVAWLQLLVRARDAADAVPKLERAFRPEAEAIAAAMDNEAERSAVRLVRLHLQRATTGDPAARRGLVGPGVLLGSMVAVLLLVTCTNVSGLLLVRSMARVRELGVRLALGAAAWRVARLALLEALILSLAGSLCATLLAFWTIPIAAQWLSTGDAGSTAISLRCVGLLTVLALATTFAAAVAPILWMVKLDPRTAFGQAPISGRPLRFGRFFVALQFALAAILVALAQSLAARLERTLATDPGVAARQILTVSYDASTAGYPEAERLVLAERLRTAAAAVPGVEAATFAASGFMVGSQSRSGLYFRSKAARVRRGHYQHDAVPPGYFGTIGAKLLRGRDFTSADHAEAPRVAIVSATFAREIYGETDPMGQTFSFGTEPSDEDWTVVGVVSDIRANGIAAASPAMFYTPATQWSAAMQFLAVRTRAPAAEVVAGLRKALGAAAPGVLFNRWRTAEERINDDLRPQRSGTTAASAFAGLAVVLAACGIAASVGYLILLRRREFAVRMALGAAPAVVRRGVFADAVRLALSGALPGVAVAWYLTRLPALSPALDRIDVATIALVVGATMAAAVVAGWLPARRASQFEPSTLLGSE